MAGTGEPEFNPNDPATRGDVLTTVQQSETRILGRIAELIEASETRLLTSFYDWARASNARAGNTETNLRSHEERLAAIEGRLLKLEARKS